MKKKMLRIVLALGIATLTIIVVGQGCTESVHFVPQNQAGNGGEAGSLE